MILLLLAAAQQTPAKPVAGPPSPEEVRYHDCLGLATTAPKDAESKANQWRLDGGGFVAQQCLGVAYANQERWSEGAVEFEGAARAAQMAHDDRAATYWAEAGNAWLAAGNAGKARAALDAALAAGTLDDTQRGEAQLDRARALVATGNLAEARADIDHALVLVPKDPLAWLLSATLARRMGDLPRAHKDIAEAETRAPNSAAVQLEAGNIAALSDDAASAKAAWQKAVTLAPDSAAAASAREALAQFTVPGAP